MELRLDEGPLGEEEAAAACGPGGPSSQSRPEAAGGSVAGMTRIAAPESGMGEHIDWALLRPEMAAGMGKLSAAVYGNSQLLGARARGGPLDHRADQRLRRVPRHPGP